MRGARAKEIRRAVYGDRAPTARRYRRDFMGVLIADDRRRHFQRAKRRYGRLLRGEPRFPAQPKEALRALRKAEKAKG